MPLHTGTEIIVLKAKGNAGKTTLLNSIITSMNIIADPFYTHTYKCGDKIVIYVNYTCNDGIKRNIAFITQGDANKVLARNYNKLLSKSNSIDIDILVGACKDQGKYSAISQTEIWWNDLRSSIPCVPSINFITPHSGRRVFWDATYIIDITDLATVRRMIKV